MEQLAPRAESVGRPFAWGIVGTGTIARMFADDLKHAGGARVAAVASREGAKAERFARDAGAPKAYGAIQELLADPAVDAVYIATPNHLHTRQAILAIEAGKPVLVEKPLATASADAEAVVAAAARRGVFVMEALWSRFLPAVAFAKSLVEGGALGRIERVEAELAYRHEETGDSRFFDPELGGGAALDLGVYPLSLAMFLLGEPDTVDGRWRAAKSGVDLRSDFALRWGTVQAELSCGFDRDGTNTFRILGTDGALTLSAPFLKAQRVIVHGRAMGGMPLVGARSKIGGGLGKIIDRLPLPGRQVRRFAFPGNGLQFEALHVAEEVRARRTQSAFMPPAASLAVLRAIERVRSAPPQD